MLRTKTVFFVAAFAALFVAHEAWAGRGGSYGAIVDAIRSNNADVIGPIFEADLLDNQYEFRTGLDAKMAVRRVFWHITQWRRREVIDADLRDYFTSIPHGPLMRCLTRRIADGRLLRVIKSWLTATVVERAGGRTIRTAEARKTKRGTPQGSPLSPALANIY